MFCPKCGSQVTKGNAFCPECGTPVQGQAPAQPVYQQQAYQQPVYQQPRSPQSYDYIINLIKAKNINFIGMLACTLLSLIFLFMPWISTSISYMGYKTSVSMSLFSAFDLKGGFGTFTAIVLVLGIIALLLGILFFAYRLFVNAEDKYKIGEWVLLSVAVYSALSIILMLIYNGVTETYGMASFYANAWAYVTLVISAAGRFYFLPQFIKPKAPVYAQPVYTQPVYQQPVAPVAQPVVQPVVQPVEPVAQPAVEQPVEPVPPTTAE